MIRIPYNIDKDFKIFLLNKGVPKTYFYYYCKWLRYYLDFCQKYNFQQSEQKSFSQFITKLQKKLNFRTTKTSISLDIPVLCTNIEFEHW